MQLTGAPQIYLTPDPAEEVTSLRWPPPVLNKSHRKDERSVTEETKRCLCQHMSQKLLVLRTMLRLSQAELAQVIGVSRQTVVAMEANKRPISWNTFLSLILVFSKHKSTNQLMRLCGIYTDELDRYLFAGDGGDDVLLPEQTVT